MKNDAALARVTIIVVTFNSAHCIETLAKSLKSAPQVCFVDNASIDDTCGAISRSLPNAKLISLTGNLGFGAANNRAITETTTEFVLLLNPDCEIALSAIAEMIQCADQFPDASAIGPQLFDRNGNADMSYRWQSSGWKSKGAGADAPLCVGFISGACMLLRREAMQKIGGFDERFFLYYEDEDLCLRLIHTCGAIIVCPEAKVTHLSRSGSGGKAIYHAEYLRGFHHIQSKFRFEEIHFSKRASVMRKFRYGAVAALESSARLLIFDRRRATRAWGRVMGLVKS